jgi:hypothetical protein
MPALSPELRAVLRELPFALAETLEGYAISVDANRTAIFEEAGLTQAQSDRLGDEFIFAATVRRLWSLVDAQFWVLTHSLDLLERREVSRVRLGGARFSRESPAYREVRELRASLRVLLRRLGVFDLATADSLPAVAQKLAEESA